MDAAFEVQAVMSLVDMITGPLRHVRSDLNRTGAAATSLATRMGNLASSMMPVAAAASGVLLGMGKAVNVAMDFEHGLSRLAAVSDATQSEMIKLKQSALDLGAATAFSAAQALRAQEDLAKAGFAVSEIIGAMPGVLSLAAAGDLELVQATEIASDTIKTFGLSASDMGMVADVLSKTANAASTDVTQMGQTLKNAGTTAAAAHVSLVELSAMAGKMSDMGIKGAEAGTQLKTMMLRLQGPTGDAAKTLAKMGVAVKDASGNMLPIFDILRKLETSLAGVGTASRAEKLKKIFGDDAINAVNALLNTGIDKVRTFAGEIQNSTGSAAQTAARMLDDLKGALLSLSGSWETLQIVIGSVFLGELKDAAQSATRLINVLTSLSENPLGQWLIRIVAYLSAVVVGVTAIAGAVWAASWVWGVFVSSLSAVGSALAALAWPILALAAAVAVVYVAWRNNLGGIADTVSGWYQKISLVVRGVIAVFGSLKGSVGTIEGDLAKEIRAAGLEGLVTTVAKVVARVKALFVGIWEGLQTGWNMAMSVLAPAVDGLITALGPVVNLIMDVIAWLFGSAASTDANAWKLLGEVVGTLVGGAFSLLAGVLAVIVYAVTDVVAIINVLGSTIGTAAGWVVVKFKEIASAVRSVVAWISDAASSIAQAWEAFSLSDWVSNMLAVVSSGVASMVQSVLGNVTGMIQALLAVFQGIDIVQWVQQAFTVVLNYLGSINLFESGARIIGTIIDGIKSKFAALKGAVSSAFADVRKLLPFSDAKEGPLAGLTASGMAIMLTLGHGVNAGASDFKDSVSGAMAGAVSEILTLSPVIKVEHVAALPQTAKPLELNGMARYDVVPLRSPMLPELNGMARYDTVLPEWHDPGYSIPPLDRGGRFDESRTVKRTIPDGAVAGWAKPKRDIIIQNLTVQLPQVQNGSEFVSRLKAYVEQFDAS